MATLVAPLPVTSRISDHMTDAQQSSVSADLPKLESGISPARKPKLSLQTTSLASGYGSLTRGIAPNAAQATYTPTTTNTLVNQWDLQIRPSPVSRTESPRPVPPKQQLPYILTLPFGIKSILKNSPLPRQASVSASPRDSRRKVFFPQPKRVSFRSNLEDPIENTVYTARHVDLSSSDEESPEGTPSSQKNSEDDVPEYRSPPPSRKRKLRRDTITPTEPSTQDKQSENAKEGSSLKSSQSCKRRKWQWTLPVTVQSSSEIPELLSETHSPTNTDEDQTVEKRHDCDTNTNTKDEPKELPCDTCSDQEPNLRLGSPPDVVKPESVKEDIVPGPTCQEYEDKNS